MTHQIQLFLDRVVRLAGWPLMIGAMLAVLAPAAQATQPVYEVDESVSYVIPPDNLPPIDATTFFVNQATLFSIDYATPTAFETYNTLNYTNYGAIIANTAFAFDTQTTDPFGDTEHLMASNFDNPGEILCGSTNDLFVEGVAEALPQCIINAANVVNNNGGMVDVGQNGLLQINGGNVDLSDGVLTVDGNGLGFIQALPYSNIGVYIAGSGIDTNKDWDPSMALSANSSYPSDVRIGTFNPALWEMPFGQYPTTAYYETNEVATNDFIYRSVFAYNGAPNVIDNVYINGPLGTLNGAGEAAVEFIGAYTNPSTGVVGPEYLYVRDDYVEGSLTNVPVNTLSHIPINFTFQTSLQPLISQSAETPNFTPFPAGILTNTYAYADVECLPTTVPTNSVSPQNTNYLATMAGSIQVTASNLDVTGAQIFYQNYVSLTVSNQFNGSAGANIVSPYANFNLTATNASLMVTNLLEPTTPAWNGQLGAYSTRWLNIISNVTLVPSTNNTFTTNSYAITNDYRVFIVINFANPGAPSSVWNLSLHDTNSVTISDVYNVLNSLYLNCTSLTLTTNNNGFGSPCGELNLTGTSVNWATATPNLRYLTNNGDILLANNGYFGSAAAPYGALINSGEISDLGSQVWAGNFVDTGLFINSEGSFILNAQTALMTNSILETVADTSITTGSLITSNFEMLAERSLTLTVTNLLTDTGPSPTNDSIWVVGDTSIGNGLKLTRLPAIASLLGTSIYDYAPTNRTIVNNWPGIDEGAVNQGYTNNAAVGQLILDAEGPAPLTQLYFSGTGTSNAIYVDRLILTGYSAYSNHVNNSISSLGFNTNLVIYYADAIAGESGGVGDVSFQINGFNGNHLRWVPTYTGYFSSTNIVYPNGSTNTYNIGLAESPFIDSNANGTPNSIDPTPFFVTSQINFMDYATNNPPNSAALSWNTIPLATNYVYYTIDFTNWQLVPNLYLMTNPFVTPSPAPGPITNIVEFDPTPSGRYYRVMVSPDLLNP